MPNTNKVEEIQKTMIKESAIRSISHNRGTGKFILLVKDGSEYLTYNHDEIVLKSDKVPESDQDKDKSRSKK